MSVYVIDGPSYHQAMANDGLPHPATGMTVSELQERQAEVLELLERGGAIILHTDDGEQLLGVLTRDEPLVGDAMVAAMIDTGNIPPIDELLAMDDRGELPFGPYRDWKPTR